MTKIKQLLGSDKEVFYPQTHQNAILMNRTGEENSTLSDYLLKLEKTVQEIDSEIFKKSCSISSNKTFFEFNNTTQEGILTISTNYKKGEIPVEDIDSLTISVPDGIALIDYDPDFWKEGKKNINFSINPNYNYSGTIKLTIESKGSTIESSVNLTQRAPSFIGLCDHQKESNSDNSVIINSLKSNISTGLAKKITSTQFSTTTPYKFTTTTEKQSFWIATPFSLPKSYSNNGGPMTITTEDSRIGHNSVKYMGITYLLARNSSDNPLTKGISLNVSLSYS